MTKTHKTTIIDIFDVRLSVFREGGTNFIFVYYKGSKTFKVGVGPSERKAIDNSYEYSKDEGVVSAILVGSGFVVVTLDDATEYLFWVTSKVYKFASESGTYVHEEGSPCASYLRHHVKIDGPSFKRVSVNERSLTWEGNENVIRCALWADGHMKAVFEGREGRFVASEGEQIDFLVLFPYGHKSQGTSRSFKTDEDSWFVPFDDETDICHWHDKEGNRIYQ